MVAVAVSLKVLTGVVLLVNEAVSVLLAFIVIEQTPVPVQAPDQPEKR